MDPRSVAVVVVLCFGSATNAESSLLPPQAVKRTARFPVAIEARAPSRRGRRRRKGFVADVGMDLLRPPGGRPHARSAGQVGQQFRTFDVAEGIFDDNCAFWSCAAARGRGESNPPSSAFRLRETQGAAAQRATAEPGRRTLRVLGVGISAGRVFRLILRRRGAETAAKRWPRLKMSIYDDGEPWPRRGPKRQPKAQRQLQRFLF